MTRLIPPDPTDPYIEGFTIDSPANGEIIDGLGPVVPINVTGNAPYTDDTLISVSVEVKISDGAFQPAEIETGNGGPWSYAGSVTNSGQYKITAKLTGTVVVREQEHTVRRQIEITVTVTDKVPPVLTITDPSSDLTLTGTDAVTTIIAKGSATDVLSGVQVVEWSLDAQNFTPATPDTTAGWESWSATIPIPLGINVVTFRCRDKYSNAVTTTRNITVSLPPPKMNEIAMVAAGSDGGSKLWDGEEMQPGNHLRWFFDPLLGFPQKGFELYRRRSEPPKALNFDLLSGRQDYSDEDVIVRTLNPNVGLTVDSNLRLRVSSEAPDAPIEIRFKRSAWYARIALQPAKDNSLTIQGELRGITVFSTKIISPRVLEYTVELDRVKLSGEGWITLLQFAFHHPNENWESIAGICLPVTDARYSCRHPHADGKAGDEAEARARLPQVQRILEGYVNGTSPSAPRPFLDQLHPVLVALATRDIPTAWTRTSFDPSGPNLENVDPLSYILLLSLDPYLARILGLYYIDNDTEVQGLERGQPGFDYKVEGHWLKEGASGTEVITYAAIVENVSPHSARNLPVPPQNLGAWELKGWALSPPADAVGLNAVGLNWTPGTDMDEERRLLVPTTAPLVVLEWRRRISGSESFIRQPPMLALPANRSPSAPPVADSTRIDNERLAALEFLITGTSPANPEQPNPPVDPLRYIHMRLEDGTYEYRLRTADIFGRISVESNTATAQLANKLQPPAPMLLAARYIQPDDPKLLLAAQELAWLNDPGNGGMNGLRVMWAWPPAAYHRAPKTLTFKVYGPDMEAQTIPIDDPKINLSGVIDTVTLGAVGKVIQVVHLEGNITKLEQIGNIVYRLITDIILPQGLVDAFIGAGLVQGGRTYKIIGHTGGPDVAFWVELSTQIDPPPGTGAFALNQSLVMTNILFQRGAERLVGGELAIGTNLCRVLAYNGGSTYLVQHDPATPPAPGGFSLQPFAAGSGRQATIKSSSDDSNTQTSTVQVDLFIPAGSILAGGTLESGGRAFEILENTGGNLDTGRSTIKLRWTGPQERPGLGACVIKAPSFFTLEADHVLAGLSTEPRKVGGWVEQETFQVLQSLPQGVTIPVFLAGKVRYDAGRQALIVSGAMTSEEKERLLSLSPDVPFQQAVEPLYHNSQGRTGLSDVLGVWEGDSSTSPTMRKTCFLVTSLPGTGAFTYHPSYEVILPVPVEVQNASIVNTEALTATIKQVTPKYLFSVRSDLAGELNIKQVSDILRKQFQEYGIILSPMAVVVVIQAGNKWTIVDTDQTYLILSENQTLNVYTQKSMTITTDRDLVAQRSAFDGGTLQAGGVAYKVVKATSLSPLTLTIEKPDTTAPLPTIDSVYTVSGISPGIAVVKTNKAGKGWQWFVGGVLRQAGKELRVVGYSSDDELLVMKAADGTAPAPGAFTYEPLSESDPTAQGWVSMTAVGPNGESAPSVPLSVTTVYRRKPEDFVTPALGAQPPVSVADPACLQATPANWYGQSYYTLEWSAESGKLYQVYRAMDAAVYDLDREERARASQPRPRLTTANLPQRIQNHPDAQLILQAIQPDFDDLDSKIAAWKSATTADEKTQRLDELEQTYTRLRNDTHEVLANLPHTADAFTLLTKEPIKPDGTAAAFRDQLPGRSSNRFFYRIAAVDGAGNKSFPSPASPPVCYPDVTPPKAPLITRVLGGNRLITIYWASNREEDLKEYHVYRAASKDAASDPRLMTLVHSEVVQPSNPKDRPAEVKWTDKQVLSRVTYYYCVAAADNRENISTLSPLALGCAFDDSYPDSPMWNAPQPGTTSDAIVLSWHSSIANLRCLVQRRATGATRWDLVSSWLERGSYTFTDSGRLSGIIYDYRLLAMDTNGRLNNQFQILTV